MSKEKNSFPLFESIKTVITETQQYVVRNVNSAMTLAYFRIGKMIVEDEQDGNERAGYAQEILKKLSTKLTDEFGRGYSNDNLEFMRKFYLTYQNRSPQTLYGDSENPISESLIRKSESPFQLSWTHYIQLLKIKVDDERSFYEIEAANNNWSVRELKRQYGSSLFERLALGKDKDGVRRLAEKGQILKKPVDAVKSHVAVEAALKALGVSFKKQKDVESYDPEFAAKIERSRQDVKEGKFSSVNEEDLQTFLGLK